METAGLSLARIYHCSEDITDSARNHGKIISSNDSLENSPWASHLSSLSQLPQQIGDSLSVLLGSSLPRVLICGPLTLFRTTHICRLASQLTRRIWRTRQGLTFKDENYSGAQVNHRVFIPSARLGCWHRAHGAGGGRD